MGTRYLGGLTIGALAFLCVPSAFAEESVRVIVPRFGEPPSTESKYRQVFVQTAPITRTHSEALRDLCKTTLDGKKGMPVQIIQYVEGGSTIIESIVICTDRAIRPGVRILQNATAYGDGEDGGIVYDGFEARIMDEDFVLPSEG